MNTIYDRQLKYEKALEYEIFVKGEYSFSKKEIQDAKCIFDIGGHKGFFSRWCRTMDSVAMIHYFEPIGVFYNQAKRVLRSDKNIILNNCGIGSKLKKGTMLLNREKTMQSSKYSSFLNPKGTEIMVDFITLKDYLCKNHIDEIDILKMDIEGMEFEVLSSRGDFEWERIDNLIVEIHLLNERMKLEWNEIFMRIKAIFESVEVINSEYSDDVFLLRAKK